MTPAPTAAAPAAAAAGWMPHRPDIVLRAARLRSWPQRGAKRSNNEKVKKNPAEESRQTAGTAEEEKQKRRRGSFEGARSRHRERTRALDVSLEAPSACAALHESRVVVVSEAAASASAPLSRAAAHGDARRRALAHGECSRRLTASRVRSRRAYPRVALLAPPRLPESPRLRRLSQTSGRPRRRRHASRPRPWAAAPASPPRPQRAG